MRQETIQLETLRQKIEDTEFEAGDRSNYLDYGKPSAAEAKQAQELIGKLNAQSKALRAEFKQLIAATRSQIPQAFEEWIDYHTATLQKILEENDTGPSAAPRRLVAKQTLEEWEKVRAGEQDYVNINWHFLKDYKAQVRTITGGAETAPKTEQTAPENKKGKSWWPFGR